MNPQTQIRNVAEDMVWMAWFLTGSEQAARALLQHVFRERHPPALSLLEAAHENRLALVSAFHALFVEGGATLPQAVTDDNPLWQLMPADRTAFVVRIVLAFSECASAAFLNITEKDLQHRIDNAAATFVKAHQRQSEAADVANKMFQ